MKKIILSLFTFLFIFLVVGQQGDGGLPNALKDLNYKQIDQREFSKPDVEALRAEDEINDPQKNGPWRFGYNHYTSLNMSNSGTWIDYPNGDRIWMLLVKCEEALTVNLTLKDVKIPLGNELYVYNPDKSFILGKFTEYHLYNGELGTELIPGNTAVLEYYVPAANKNSEASLGVSIVTHGYRTANEFMTKAFGSSGSCNRNANCAEGAAWTNERNAAVMLVSGSSGFCSGSLINNTLNDGKPYVLTANHCYSNPASWIFRFNWQSTDCTNPSTSPTFQSLSGAVLRAKGSASDFCLVEITGGLAGGTVPTDYSPYFSGWDNSGVTPTMGVGIHHPSGDIKKISFENQPLISTTFGGGSPNTHWGVTGWDTGVTEGGSSGSPLYDQNHRIVGQLHGGASACGAPVLSDEYGKVSYSWLPSGSDCTNQLKCWLDPNNSGAVFIDGYDPSGSSAVALDAGLNNPQGVSGTFCVANVSPQVTISNSGTSPITQATITYGFDGQQNLTFNWSGNLTQWQTETITLPSASLSGGNHTFSAVVSSPNGGTDENALNNTISSSFTTVVNGETATLSFDLDCYGSETSWILADELTGNTLFSSSAYTDGSQGIVTQDFCLNTGCYLFILNDTYGDGLSGCSATNGANGSYQIVWNNLVAAELLDADANFGTQNIQSFCLPVLGLNELMKNDQIVIYPNPADDRIQLKLLGNNNLMNAQITSLSGQLVNSIQLSGQVAELNVSTLSSGCYLVKVTTSNGEITRPITIK